MMYTTNRTATTDMEVTSIRLERELKEKLKVLAGGQGYQALIRDVLWDYVQQQAADRSSQLSRHHIRVSMAATAQQEERCALTGEIIPTQQPMLLGWTKTGDWVPLSLNSLEPQPRLEPQPLQPSRLES